MSEAPEAMTDDAPSSEAEFEAARLAQDADDAPEDVAEASEEGEEPAEKTVDWQKRAIDKEGLAAKERARRRAAEQRARDLEERLSRLEQGAKPADAQSQEDLLSLIANLRDDDDDPITDLAQIKRALKTFRAEQASEAEREAQANAQRRNLERLTSAMSEAEADFAEDHPDYLDAVEHFRKARREEMEDMGYAGAELEAALAQDFLALVTRSINGGKDPAEVVYNLAKKRGFLSGKAAAEEKLRKISAASTAGKVPTGGKNGEGRITVESLNKLKGAAYDAAWKKFAEQERRAG